ncbi:response regulator transcription factor [Synechococcus sp. 1G10]|uniref:response regulator transcription factor n=1 Tax=Synechococcus sp. 1G10 TaxID=2025605 RepID=UPI000B9969C4|nr:response regulator transcription factor [Synechococcus sp. 1G10]
MVDLDRLEALDTLIWMRGSDAAAIAIFATQSTIIRRSRHALQAFGVSLQRGHGTWRVSGDSDLLDLERRIHQEARFCGNRRLRLHMPWWTSSLINAELRKQVAIRWTAHPDGVRNREDDPISLLKNRVIDACFVTPTQMPVVDPDLSVIDLYQSDIHLMALTDDRVPFLDAHHEANGFRLQLFDFLPQSCRAASRAWFDRHVDMEDLEAKQLATSQPTANFAYLTPNMAQAAGIHVTPLCLTPRPYVERLVVRKEYRYHPDVEQLLAALSDSFARFGSRVKASDVTFPYSLQDLHGRHSGAAAPLFLNADRCPASPLRETERQACLIVEDQGILAELLAENLAQQLPGLMAIQTAGTVEEGVRVAQTCRPRILILDLFLPDGSGLEVAEVLLAVEPSAQVIVLTAEPHRMQCSRHLHQAITAVLDKTQALDRLHEQVKALLHGSEHPRDCRASRLGDLTDREIEVLQLIGQGLSSKEISRRLTISLGTAQTHRKNIISKLGIKGGELVLFAARQFPARGPVRA